MKAAEMSRFFNTSGPCRSDLHYMLPAAERLPGVLPLVEMGRYFVVHAPRQTGKTTTLAAVAAELNASGRFAAVLASCEEAQAAGEDLELGLAAVMNEIAEAGAELPAAARPPAPAEFGDVEAISRLKIFLGRWAERSPLPVVLFLDEIDAVIGAVLTSILRQIRVGYSRRPDRFPQAIGLVGMRDVRDYRLDDHERFHSASPFNIKDRSFLLPNFTAEDVASLCRQHSDATGQVFRDGAVEHAFELTRGQPWLVNALAQQITLEDVVDRAIAIEIAHVEAAKETLIRRRDTHVDSLLDRLRERRVRGVIEPLLAGELIVGDRLDDDKAYVEDLGLIDRSGGHIRIANPIYHEIIPRALAAGTQDTIPHHTAWYVGEDGRLDMAKLLDGFVDFWLEHGEALLGAQPYPEIAPHLILMAFLQRVVNSGGFIDREYALGRGRLDICIRWPHGDDKEGLDGHAGNVQREALELKVWRDGRPDPLSQGRKQLAEYLARLGLDAGTLIIFDRRRETAPLAERLKREQVVEDGRHIDVLRL